ncbi:MAG: RecX family transcriptional regulator [Rikenellaceae bacterium]|nr:RecX family transcriptional regulator [Rikenellaceae bacterium]
MELRKKRTLSTEAALKKLMDRCARAEICISDAKRSLANWGVDHENHDGLIEILVREKFIDENRYAEAYVRDKLNFSRWGVNKIRDALYNKRIPKDIINTAMELVEPEKMRDKLIYDLKRKNSSINDEDPYKKKDKLLKFGISRGYEYELVKGLIETIIKEE